MSIVYFESQNTSQNAVRENTFHLCRNRHSQHENACEITKLHLTTFSVTVAFKPILRDRTFFQQNPRFTAKGELKRRAALSEACARECPREPTSCWRATLLS